MDKYLNNFIINLPINNKISNSNKCKIYLNNLDSNILNNKIYYNNNNNNNLIKDRLLMQELSNNNHNQFYIKIQKKVKIKKLEIHKQVQHQILINNW